MGAIHIITKNGKDLNGFSVSTHSGAMSKTFSHRNVLVEGGFHLGRNFMLSTSAHLGQANRSQLINYDMYGVDGAPYDMTENSGIQSILLNSHLKIFGFQSRIIYDGYFLQHRDQYDVNLQNAYTMINHTGLTELKYDIKITDKLTLTPKYKNVISKPWLSPEEVKNTDDEWFYYPMDIGAMRHALHFDADFDVLKFLNLQGGGEFVHDYVYDKLDNNTFANGEKNQSYTSSFIYTLC